MVERKSGRTLDHLGHLLDTGSYHVVLVDGAKVRVEEGEVVRLEEIENAEYAIEEPTKSCPPTPDRVGGQRSITPIGNGSRVALSIASEGGTRRSGPRLRRPSARFLPAPA